MVKLKPIDVRIGNYLTRDGRIFQVIVIDITETNSITKCQPIKLTKEHLEKANFNFKELGFNDLSVSYGLTSKDIHFVIGNYYKKLDYLHQLQNIYYDFVGQELTFKK